MVENDSLSQNVAATVVITVSPAVFTRSKNVFGNKKPVSKTRKSAVRAEVLVNIFKNCDDLFYAWLEFGNVNDNSTFIPVYQSH